MKLKGTRVVCIGLVLLSADCFADGRIVLQPRVGTEMRYDSNFWKAEDNEVGVNSYSVRPGLELGYETPRTQVSLDVTVEPHWYDDQDATPPGVADASDDDFVGFTGLFRGYYQFTDRLNIGVKDQLYVTRDPAHADVNSNSISRDKYTINYVEPIGYYELTDKFGLRGAYRNTYTDYEMDLEDSTENRGIFALYYTLNSTSKIYVDYQVWERDYSQDSSDYLSNLITLNYEAKFKYFTFLAGAGYHNRTFGSEGPDDLDLFSWKFEAARMDADSTEETTRSRLKLAIGQEMNDDGTGDQYFTATFLRFEGGYRFTDRIEASTRLEYQNSNYEQSEEEDDTSLVSARLAYTPFDFLTIGLEGGYETRDSNLAGSDFDNTFVLLTLDFHYDLGNR